MAGSRGGRGGRGSGESRSRSVRPPSATAVVESSGCALRRGNRRRRGALGPRDARAPFDNNDDPDTR